MSGITLRDLFDRYYRSIQIPQASLGCVKQYRQNLAKVDDALGRAATVADLSDDLIARVCGKLLADGRSPATANKVRSQLVALWNFAARRGLISTWPTLPKFREYSREPTAWTREQLEALFAECQRQPGFIGPASASLWWLGLLSLLWDSGLRIGAAMQLRWAQVDFTRGYVLVLAEQQKDREDKWFRLHPQTLAVLRLLRGSDAREGLLFPWDKADCVLWQRFGEILRKAGLPATRRDKFHRIRRSVASHFKAGGGDPQDAMGHSTYAVTQKYLDSTITGKVHPADLLFRPR